MGLILLFNNGALLSSHHLQPSHPDSRMERGTKKWPHKVLRQLEIGGTSSMPLDYGGQPLLSLPSPTWSRFVTLFPAFLSRADFYLGLKCTPLPTFPIPKLILPHPSNLSGKAPFSGMPSLTLQPMAFLQWFSWCLCCCLCSSLTFHMFTLLCS